MKPDRQDKIARKTLDALARGTCDASLLSSQTIKAIVRYFDRQTTASFTKPDPTDSPEDILFERLMTRLETMRPDRPAMKILFDRCRRQPPLARALTAALYDSMFVSLRAAQPKGANPQGPLATALCCTAYGFTFLHWLRDDSADMQLCMARLDATIRACKPLLFRHRT